MTAESCSLPDTIFSQIYTLAYSSRKQRVIHIPLVDAVMPSDSRDVRAKLQGPRVNAHTHQHARNVAEEPAQFCIIEFALCCGKLEALRARPRPAEEQVPCGCGLARRHPPFSLDAVCQVAFGCGSCRLHTGGPALKDLGR